MIYILENDKLKVKISSLGAEIQSVRRLEDDTEYMWQGDTAYWGGRAPNLFPFCGRNVEGKYIYAGKEYEGPKHGFARHSEWSVLHQKAAALTLQLQDSEETRAIYPFRFSLELTYTLSGETLSIAYILHNLDDKTMYFALGGHPAFNVPLRPEEQFEDYSLVFDWTCQPRLARFSSKGYFLDANTPYPLQDEQTIPLTHALFDKDIFLTDVSREVTLCNPAGPRSVHLSFPDMPYVGFWHPDHTDAPFVCIEPWSSMPARDGFVNVLEEKEDMLTLNPAEVYRTAYTITFG